MLGQEFIHIEQGLFATDALNALPQLVVGDVLGAGGLGDDTVAEAWSNDLQKRFSHYRFLFPDAPRLVSNDPSDCGFLLTNPCENESTYPTGTMEGRRILLVGVVFTNNQRWLRFPRQGLQIRGYPGRMVIFPAYWMHQYQLLGRGTVVLSYQLYNSVESSVGRSE